MSAKLFFILPIALFLFFFYGPERLEAQTYVTEKGYAKVKGGNAMTSYVGFSPKLEGELDLESGELAFELPLESLKTGIERRDQHMYETLETEEHPKARFEGEMLDEPPGPGEKGNVTVEGRFTIHGKSKTIEVSGTMDRSGDAMKVEAAFSIMITEYGMERPGWSFASVRDEHRIEVEAELSEQDDQG